MIRTRHPLGPAHLGTERHLVSLRYGAPGVGEKAYLQASLHADELPGMLVMHHLIARLDAAEAAGRMRGEVVLVPVANPIGLSQQLLRGAFGRFDAATGENFNRGYPDFKAAITPGIEARLGPDAAKNREAVRTAMRAHVEAMRPTTELAALRRTLSFLACDADVVLDLHCDLEAVLHLYCESPYWPQCEPLARLLGAETILLAKNSGGQSFDEAMSGVWWQLDEWLDGRPGSKPPIPMACMAVTVELRGQADVSHALAARDADALFAFLVARGLVAATGDEAPMPQLRVQPAPLAGSEDIDAPHAGVIVFCREPGDTIAAGDLVAEIVDPLAGLVTPLRALRPGLLYARARRRYAAPGDNVAKISGATPFRTGSLLSP